VAHIRIFKHYIHLPFVFTAILDALVLAASFILAVYFQFFLDVNLFATYFNSINLDVGVYVLMNLMLMLALGVYQAEIEEGMIGMVLRTIFSVIISVVVLSSLFYISKNSFWFFGNGVLTSSAVFSIFLLSVMRFMFFSIVNERSFKKNILILGAGNRAKNLIDDLQTPLDTKGFNILGYVAIPEESSVIAEDKLIHVPTTLYNYVSVHDVDEIVVALDDRRKRLPLEDLIECKMAGIGIVDAPNFYERESRKVALEMIQPSWIIFSEDFGFSATGRYIKRFFDILASVFLLILSWPFMLLTAMAIKLEEGISAPIIYSQERIGLNGKTFYIHKFRSMRVDAEKEGKAVWAKKNDSRVTLVGDFIRKVRIDELPQVFNVLKGEMAFVGPRPERPVFVKQLAEQIPFYNERHRTKPGITGWAQMCFAYADNAEDSKEKLRYDLYYIKNQSVMLDLMILLQTVEVVLFKKGSR
jgi:sugar transferase (PEP-CTERM system associated)